MPEPIRERTAVSRAQSDRTQRTRSCVTSLIDVQKLNRPAKRVRAPGAPPHRTSVIQTVGDDPHGPFGDFQLIDIKGYDRSGQSNLYMFNANVNPLDRGMLIGLFPVNEGQDDEVNADGESYIALSLSCDGVHWSRVSKVLWTRGLEGRTFAHPVDGIVFRNNTVF
eukprot:6159422-Prymnesium_polylepis.1